MFSKTVLKIHLCFILGLLLLMTGCATALMQVAEKGDINGVKALLDQGADVNESFYGNTALMSASSCGHTDVVKLLIERGVNVNTMTQIGSSALGYAAIGGHRDVMKILIDNGANVDAAIRGLEQGTAIVVGHPDLFARIKMGIKLLEKTVKKQEIANQPTMPVLRPSQEVSPAIKSDVDDLPPVTAKPNKNAYAIVIGVEKYRQKLPKADYADNDARIMAEYLTKVMGYPEENVVTLLNDRALKSDFEKYFEKWLGNNVEKGSSVFIYFSGHGAPNTKTGDAYLVPYDGDPTFIDQTGYSLKRMYDALGKLPAKEIVVALDSCFSGAGGRSVIAKGARPLVMNLRNNTALSKNMTVISASAGDQISSTYDEKGHGLFTYFMLKGIKNEDVLNPDGSIKMDDLFGYLKPQVERIARKQFNNEQTPQLIGAKKN
ncbi:MAG TPA: ankyrin repeat domain-containing protein [Anaerolineae bacterium]|nr:ankyrin repeat domain-containing protein [Anaerolineae bacterium]